MNTPFTAFDPVTGAVLYSGTASDPDALASASVSIHGGAVFSEGWMQDGVHYELPEQPSPAHVFNWVTKQWGDPRTLQDFKETQWATIKQARTSAEYAGFTWDGSTFDSDAISQNRITGAVTLAMLSPAFVIDWILADNTTRLLDQTSMAQVGAALGTHVATQFTKGVMLRAAIEAATTQAEVEAVVW